MSVLPCPGPIAWSAPNPTASSRDSAITPAPRSERDTRSAKPPPAPPGRAPVLPPDAPAHAGLAEASEGPGPYVNDAARTSGGLDSRSRG
jgi:hypothetical protein